MIDLKKFGAKAVTILPDSVIRIQNSDKEIEIKLSKEITIKGGKFSQQIAIQGEILKEMEKEK